jgi:pSer/pThr/pTyr-binding forkhead associated (FHA) protein
MRSKKASHVNPILSTQTGERPQKRARAAAPEKKALLLVVSRGSFGSMVVMQRGSVVLGRQKDCEFVIDDPLLSRRHCLITVDARSDFYLEDLNSTNATMLNSRTLKKRTRLKHGDRIVLGNTVLRFYLEEDRGRR